MSKTISTGMMNTAVNGIKINTSIPCRIGNYNNAASRNVAYVVMHYTGNSSDTAKANATYFKNNSPEASAHLFVDETSIYQSVELRDIAWHCGGKTYYHSKCRNSNSIGIEMCCSGNYKISEKTKKNAAYLCAYICKLIGITADKVDTYVLRHWDITHKECPAQMTGASNAEWTAFKSMVKSILKGSSTSDSVKTTAEKATATVKTAAVPNVSYRVRTAGKWLPAVTNLTDFAGIKGKPITDIAVKAAKGSVKYRVHIKGGRWLPYVTGYNINDGNNGYAGNGKTIDAVEIIYTNVSGCNYKIKYRVSPPNGNYYSWQIGNLKTIGMDGYAGCIGKTIDRLQISLA